MRALISTRLPVLLPILASCLCCAHLAGAQDLNGYSAPTIPVANRQPLGEPSCDGLSAINSEAADELIIRPGDISTSWGFVSNRDHSFRYIYVCPGDYREFGSIVLTQTVEVRWWSPTGYVPFEASYGPPGLLSVAYHQPPELRATVARIVIDGAPDTIIDRLVVAPGPTEQSGITLADGGGSTGVVIHGVHLDLANMGDGVYESRGVWVGATNDSFTLQYATGGDCDPTVAWRDTHVVQIDSANIGFTIAASELWNCSQQVFLGSTDAGWGGTVAGCDLYFTPDVYMGCAEEDALQVGASFGTVRDAEGHCMAGEVNTASMSGSTTAEAPMVYAHNNLWGAKEQGYAFVPGHTYPRRVAGGSGQLGPHAFLLDEYARNVVIEHNRIQNSDIYGSESAEENTNGFHLIRYNLIHGIVRHDDAATSYTAAFRNRESHSIQWQQNTVSNVSDVAGAGWADHCAVGSETVGNLVFNGASPGPTCAQGNPTHTSHNVYVIDRSAIHGEDALFFATRGDVSADHYCYFRRQITRPEYTCVIGVVPREGSVIANHLADYRFERGFGLEEDELDELLHTHPGAFAPGAGVALSDEYRPVFTVLRAPEAPIMDGDLSEFRSARSVVVITPTLVVGTLYALWDDQALYLAADVRDSTLNGDVLDHDGSLWRDDSIELLFDPERTISTYQDDDDHKLFVSVLSVVNDYHRSGDWDPQLDLAVRTLGTVGDNNNTDEGYLLEVAIPWDEWDPSVPSEGTEWGFDLKLNDDTTEEPDDTDMTSATWFNGDGNDPNSPLGFGILRFSDEIAADPNTEEGDAETGPTDGDADADADADADGDADDESPVPDTDPDGSDADLADGDADSQPQPDDTGCQCRSAHSEAGLLRWLLALLFL